MSISVWICGEVKIKFLIYTKSINWDPREAELWFNWNLNHFHKISTFKTTVKLHGRLRWDYKLSGQLIYFLKTVVIFLNVNCFLPFLYEWSFFRMIFEQGIKIEQIIIFRRIICYHLAAIYKCFHLLLIKFFVKLDIKWLLSISTRCLDGCSAVIDNNIATFVASKQIINWLLLNINLAHRRNSPEYLG